MALIISRARFQKVDIWFSRGGGQLTPPPPATGLLNVTRIKLKDKCQFLFVSLSLSVSKITLGKIYLDIIGYYENYVFRMCLLAYLKSVFCFKAVRNFMQTFQESASVTPCNYKKTFKSQILLFYF